MRVTSVVYCCVHCDTKGMVERSTLKVGFVFCYNGNYYSGYTRVLKGKKPVNTQGQIKQVAISILLVLNFQFSKEYG